MIESSRKTFSQSCTLSYGTFGMMHYSQFFLIHSAMKFNLPIVVGLSMDDFNSYKGTQAIQSYSVTELLLNQIRCIKYIFSENYCEQKTTGINLYNDKFLFMGSDWKGKVDYLSELTNVVYFDGTPFISSSDLRNMNYFKDSTRNSH